MKYLLLFCLLVLSACFEETAKEKSLMDRTVNATRIIAVGDTAYALSWQHPSDREYLKGFHIWVVQDTNLREMVTRSETNESDYRNLPHQLYYSGLIADQNKDELVWTLPDSLLKMMQADGRDSVQILLWAEYSQSIPGARQHLTLKLADVFAPNASRSKITLNGTNAIVEWDRPKDLVSEVPLKQDGVIWGYALTLTGPQAALVKLQITDTNLKLYPLQFLNKIRRPKGLQLSDLIQSTSTDTSIQWVIYDQHPTTDPKGSHIQALFTGLKVISEYTLQIRTVDLYNNYLGAVSLPDELINFRTTTLNPPTSPQRLKLNYLGPGLTEFTWEASESGNGNPEGWKNVVSYEIQLRDSTFNKDSARTFWVHSPAVSTKLKGLFPDHKYLVSIRAMDSSGHYSTASTLDTLFKSTAHCPMGFAQITTAKDTFCMAQYEFAQNGTFVTQITPQNAVDLCKGLSDNQFNVDLCTETAWKDACAHSDLAASGYQNMDLGFSLFGDTIKYDQILYGACNFASGNPKQARNPLCATSDGIFDLPAQLQEWVYKDSAGIIKDSVFTIKGASWISSYSNESYAKCAVRSYGLWKRPNAYIWGRDTVILRKGATTPERKTPMIKSTDIQKIFDETDFKDRLVIFDVLEQNKRLTSDTVDFAVTQNTSEFSSLKNGFTYTPKDTLKAFIYGSKDIQITRAYKSQALGFRCCAKAK